MIHKTALIDSNAKISKDVIIMLQSLADKGFVIK